MSCPRGCCSTYREHLTGITLSGPSPRRDADRRESKDMDAFKRLVQSGVTPAKIAGSAELERGASTSFEVEHAAIITNDAERRKIVKGFERASEVNVTPLNTA